MNQVKIMRAGMKVDLSIRGKHKVSIAFPLPGQITSVPPQTDNNDQRNERKDRKTSFILQNTMMEVKGFERKDGLIPINDSSGINAAINWDESDRLTYEIVVPLSEWLGTSYTPEDIQKDIALDIEINAVKRQVHPGSGGKENGFSGRGRGGGMGGGGGMHHQRNVSSDEEDSSLPGENKMSLFEKSKLKEKFILALPSGTK
jgi:hypothetical protein